MLLPPGTATSEPVTVKFAATVSLSLSRQVYFSWQNSTATVTVDSGASAAPTGTVTIRVNGKTVTAALVDGVAKVQLPKLRAGIHTVTATYSGDSATTGGSAQKLVWLVF